jgi:outer membrane protein TolC
MSPLVKISSVFIAIFLVASCVAAQEIPGAARIATGQPPTLSYEDAVRLAIDNNLATLEAHERRNEARGEKDQARAPLLPNISGAAYQASLTENLVALGFQPGIIPGFNSTFLGPFKNFDARLLLTQKIFDLSAIRSYQAGKAGVRVAELQEALAREQVASRTGLIYLEALPRPTLSWLRRYSSSLRISGTPVSELVLMSLVRKRVWPNSKSDWLRLKPHPKPHD